MSITPQEEREKEKGAWGKTPPSLVKGLEALSDHYSDKAANIQKIQGTKKAELHHECSLQIVGNSGSQTKQPKFFKET